MQTWGKHYDFVKKTDGKPPHKLRDRYEMHRNITVLVSKNWCVYRKMPYLTPGGASGLWAFPGSCSPPHFCGVCAELDHRAEL